MSRGLRGKKMALMSTLRLVTQTGHNQDFHLRNMGSE